MRTMTTPFGPHSGPCVAICSMLIVLYFGIVTASSQEIAIDATDAPTPEEAADDPLGLSRIRDNDWLSADENRAYYGLLQQASVADQKELATQAIEFLAERRNASRLSTFVDMIRNTKEFRGQPVQLKGHVLQTIEYEATENEYGIQQLYETNLYTDDSQSHPATIVFLEKPENLPISGEMVDGVTVNGYFLKTYLYPSSDNTTRKAPLILAKTVTVRPPKPAELPATANGLVYWVLGILFLILMIVVVSVQRADRKRVLENQKRRLTQEPPAFG